MNMSLVGVKRGEPRLDPHAKNAERIECRDKHHPQEYGRSRPYVKHIGIDIHVVEFQPEKSDLVAQRQRPGIPHEYFHPLSRHVVKEKDAHHAGDPHRHHAVNIQFVPAEPSAQRPQGEQGKPRTKAVDPVDQVIRIDQQNHHQHRQDTARPYRDLIQPEKTAQVLDSYPAENQQDRRSDLHHKLAFVRHARQIVRQPGEKNERGTRYQKHDLAENIRFQRGRRDIVTQIVPQSHHQRNREQESREESDAAQTGNIRMMELTFGKLIEKLLFFSDQDDFRNRQTSDQSRNQKRSYDKQFQHCVFSRNKALQKYELCLTFCRSAFHFYSFRPKTSFFNDKTLFL